jgi:hypothetical protein
MASPEDVENFQMLEADGIQLYMSKEVMRDALGPYSVLIPHHSRETITIEE